MRAWMGAIVLALASAVSAAPAWAGPDTAMAVDSGAVQPALGGSGAPAGTQIAHDATNGSAATGEAAGTTAVPVPKLPPPADVGRETVVMGLGWRETAIAAAVVGGAFSLGILATGSLVSGLSAAGAVVVTYSLVR